MVVETKKEFVDGVIPEFLINENTKVTLVLKDGSCWRTMLLKGGLINKDFRKIRIDITGIDKSKISGLFIDTSG